MTDAAISDTEVTTAPVTPPKMPPVVRLPKPVQGVLLAGFRRWFLRNALKRYGPVFAINVPFFGRSVVVSDPALARQVFLTSTDDLINVQPNLSRIFGSGSVFALDHKEHRARRKLLAPPFHGQSIKNYEKVIEEETLRETATWPEGREFPTLEPMNRITLNVILRTVFGADGSELDVPARDHSAVGQAGLADGDAAGTAVSYRPIQPVGPDGGVPSQLRLHRVRADRQGRGRSEISRIAPISWRCCCAVDTKTAPPMSHQEISDELLTLLGAGHETTASTLGWAFERLRRHPGVLGELVKENDEGGNEFRQATIVELQRNRTVIDFAGRHVLAPHFDLGDWRIPHGYTVMICYRQRARQCRGLPEPRAFRSEPVRRQPGRRRRGCRSAAGPAAASGPRSPTSRWTSCCEPCLRHFVIETDNAPEEKIHFRGIAFTPKDGGLVTVHRRDVSSASFVSISLVDMINGAMEATIPAAHKLGIKAVEARRGFAAATVPLEGNGNHFGVVYAGVEFTVAEILGGIIAIASFDAAKYYPLVKKRRHRVHRRGPQRSPRRSHHWARTRLRRVESEAAENGKADFALNAVVRDEAGQTVAVTRGLYQLRAHGK